ncbi:MAG: glycosyltransferase [Oscillospiraceae bacterium]|nr:glycosyltransferase [Oscillospiraceae bacterium]
MKSYNGKKVLITASTFGHIRSFHLPYIEEFSRLGWNVTVACAGAPKSLEGADRCVELPFKKSELSPDNLIATALLRSLIKREKFDLVITHTTLAAFFTRLAMMFTKRPKVINVVHGYLYDESTPAVKRFIYRAAEKLTAGVTDLVLTMNEYDFDEATKHRLAKRIEKIPGIGVDFEKNKANKHFDIRKEFDIPDNAFLVTFPAELSSRKNQRVLLEALSETSADVWLLLAGDGALDKEYKSLAEELGIADRTVFPGFVKEIASAYAASDAAASSSKIEGLPFNVMEAMDAGLPVILSDIKGHRDLVQNGVNGLLYPRGNSKSLAKAIMKLKAEPETREKLGKAAKLSVEKYSLGNVLPQVMKKYLSLN